MRISNHDVLLIIDVQNDFCTGGALAVPHGEEVVPVCNRLGSIFSNVVLTQDWHPPGHVSFASAHPGRAPFETITVSYGKQTLWPDHCVQGSRGAGLHGGLHMPHAQLILRKGFLAAVDSYSAFQENDRVTRTGLASYLKERQIGRIFLAGLAFDYCVRASAVDARLAGFPAIVIEDACRAIDLEGSVTRTHEDFHGTGVQQIRSEEIAPEHA